MKWDRERFSRARKFYFAGRTEVGCEFQLHPFLELYSNQESCHVKYVIIAESGVIFWVGVDVDLKTLAKYRIENYKICEELSNYDVNASLV